MAHILPIFPLCGTQRNLIVWLSSQRLKGKSGAVPGAEALIVMPIVPQLEIRVKLFAVNFKETDEKCGEILVKFFFDFRPSISREIGRKTFSQIPPHIRTSNSTRLNLNSFTAILWELVGPILFGVNRLNSPWKWSLTELNSGSVSDTRVAQCETPKSALLCGQSITMESLTLPNLDKVG